MSAGLPGFGLSGVFFVFSALLMVPIELVATLRGRSSLERWGRVLRSAGIALAILAGTELTYIAIRLVLTQLDGSGAGGHGPAAQSGGRAAASVVHAIPVLPILGTLGLVAIVIVAAKAAELLSDLRRQPAAQPALGSSNAHVELHSVGERGSEPRSHTDLADRRSRRVRVRPHGPSEDRLAAQPLQ